MRKSECPVKTIKRLLHLPHKTIEEVINDLYKEVNTPFLTLHDSVEGIIKIRNPHYKKKLFTCVSTNCDLAKGRPFGGYPSVKCNKAKVYIQARVYAGNLTEFEFADAYYKSVRYNFYYEYIRASLRSSKNLNDIIGIYINGIFQKFSRT
jgi:hypothetical protein